MSKVKFGLKNAHFAKITYSSGGSATYGTPVAMPGSVNLSLSPKGDATEFYADDGLYFTGSVNMGYSGTLEMALIPDSFKTEILGDVLDNTTKTLIENASAKPAHFALLFEVDTDVKARRVVMYDCVATRSAVGSQTKTQSTNPVTETLNLVCVPRADGIVKLQSTDTTPPATYDAWYDAVIVPGTVVTT